MPSVRTRRIRLRYWSMVPIQLSSVPSLARMCAQSRERQRDEGEQHHPVVEPMADERDPKVARSPQEPREQQTRKEDLDEPYARVAGVQSRPAERGHERGSEETDARLGQRAQQEAAEQQLLRKRSSDDDRKREQPEGIGMQ